MTYNTGRVTIGSTPTQTVIVGFQPTWARFIVSGKASDAVNHISIGTTDGTHQNTNSTFSDTTGCLSVSTNTKVISHYERVSGTITEVLSANFNSFTATGVEINVATANTAYSVTLECGN